jgi:hypothetical protein
MVEALWEQKMDFQSPSGLGTGQKIWGQRYRHRKLRGPGPNTESILGKGLGGKAPGVK